MIIYKQDYYLDPQKMMLLMAVHACNPSSETEVIGLVGERHFMIKSSSLTALNNQWIAKIRESLGSFLKDISLSRGEIRIDY